MRFILSFLACIVGSLSFAQLATLSSGGDYASEQGSVSFSMGETICSVVDVNAIYFIQQGVQQPFSFKETHELETSTYELSVYPNPASNQLSVLFSNWETTEQEIGFEILTLDGRLCLKGNVSPTEHNILDINKLVIGMYILRLQTPKQEQIKFSKIDDVY